MFSVDLENLIIFLSEERSSFLEKFVSPWSFKIHFVSSEALHPAPYPACFFTETSRYWFMLLTSSVTTFEK